MNTRRYPRTLQEAFGPYTSTKIEPMPGQARRPLLWAVVMGMVTVIAVALVAVTTA
jgi:hypothetical protein